MPICMPAVRRRQTDWPRPSARPRPFDGQGGRRGQGSRSGGQAGWRQARTCPYTPADFAGGVRPDPAGRTRPLHPRRGPAADGGARRPGHRHRGPRPAGRRELRRQAPDSSTGSAMAGEQALLRVDGDGLLRTTGPPSSRCCPVRGSITKRGRSFEPSTNQRPSVDHAAVECSGAVSPLSSACPPDAGSAVEIVRSCDLTAALAAVRPQQGQPGGSPSDSGRARTVSNLLPVHASGPNVKRRSAAGIESTVSRPAGSQAKSAQLPLRSSRSFRFPNPTPGFRHQLAGPAAPRAREQRHRSSGDSNTGARRGPVW
jgi:hypothetical protein